MSLRRWRRTVRDHVAPSSRERELRFWTGSLSFRLHAGGHLKALIQGPLRWRGIKCAAHASNGRRIGGCNTPPDRPPSRSESVRAAGCSGCSSTLLPDMPSSSARPDLHPFNRNILNPSASNTFPIIVVARRPITTKLSQAPGPPRGWRLRNPVKAMHAGWVYPVRSRGLTRAAAAQGGVHRCTRRAF
jgi:hypothetical protein